MFLTQFLVFFVVLHFLKYATRTEQIILNEWLTILCTKRNIAVAKFAVIVDLVLNVLMLSLANMPTAMTVLNNLGL